MKSISMRLSNTRGREPPLLIVARVRATGFRLAGLTQRFISYM